MQYFCERKNRVAALRSAAAASPATVLNGIEYLEIADDHATIEIHFVHDLALAPAQPLAASNIEIRGGERVRDPKVTKADALGHVLRVEVEAPGDFSTYRLRLVGAQDRDREPDGIDPALAEISFSFKADCPSPFDCQPQHECPPPALVQPRIDYLAKDYTAFTRLMFDRLSSLLPDWRERSPADIMRMLVEVLAFRADELSYYQDAVAAEAYLGTARRRISARRHARLLDYPFHDGCNARAWVAFDVTAAADGLELGGCDPSTGVGGTMLVTKLRGHEEARLDAAAAATELSSGAAQAFELIEPVTLFEAHDKIQFYTWSDGDCCLPRNATRCFLQDTPGQRLRLRQGDVLIFEEIKGRETGRLTDADRSHRHAVRLTRVDPQAGSDRSIPPERRDPVTGQLYVEIEWSARDALPFALCVSSPSNGDIAVARGNVALADHGRSFDAEPLDEAKKGKPYRPLLPRTTAVPLTYQGRVLDKVTGLRGLCDPAAPAADAVTWTLDSLRPAIELRDSAGRETWSAYPDLIDSGRFDADFVVETEEDGRSYLRFGDDVNGRRPTLADRFLARYRVGNGRAGNVGAEAIRHVVTTASGITAVRNPLPAQGGVDPHPIDQVKLYAPQAFRRQERAVTLDDYAAVAQRHPEIQRAVATRRWTGSWHTIFLTVDRRGGAAIDADFEDGIRAFLATYRLAGHDLEIDGPRFVSLDIAFDVCAKPGYFPADVAQRLLRVFGRGVLPDGTQGFFHPDRYTFGTPVYLSAMVAAAMAIPGVDFVTVTRFGRWAGTVSEIDAGFVSVGALEIARLDNDTNAPENGRIAFAVHARDRGAAS